MLKKPVEPSFFKKLKTRILNKILRRKCKGCKHWMDYHHFATGVCHRSVFVPLCEEYNWQDACEYYEDKETVAKNGK